MRTNSSSSTTLFILFNILFLYPTLGQDVTPSDPVTAPPPSSDPQSPDTTNPTPSSPPPSPVTAPPAGLDCSQCRINPIRLAACGLLINGGVMPSTLRTCCTTLKPLTKGEGAACLCYAININTIKISNIDVLTAVDKVLAACSKL